MPEFQVSVENSGAVLFWGGIIFVDALD